MRDFLLILMAFFSISTLAQKGKSPALPVPPAKLPGPQASIGSLEKRISELESSVMQLQRRVYELESGQKAAQPAPDSGWTTCTIETPFDGNFTATEPTRTAAIANSLKACKEKTSNNSVFCDKDKVVCGK